MDEPNLYEGATVQGERPRWGPLLEIVGEAIADEFMWMFEVELADSTAVQAYKHITTRRYVHLAPGARAFIFEEPNRYREVPARQALAASLTSCVTHSEV